MGQTASALEDDDNQSLDNLNFYTGKISSKPDGGKIDNVLKNWFGDWDLLEAHHGYVQWLFPIREGGLNMSAQPLSKHEAEQFRKNPQIIARAIQSYELMLDFYGLVLVSKKTGVLARNPKTYKARLMFLNNSFHNYLRMTRICKFLGILGLEHFKKQFLRHFAIEVFKYGTIRNASESCLKFWLPTLRNAQDLKELDDMIQRLLGKTYDRQKNNWHGDEQGVNWATQFYPCECPEYIYDSNDAAQQQQQQQEKIPPQDDILTHDCDPFEEVHKQYEAKQSQYMSRMRMGSYGDDDDEEDDNQVVLNHRTTGSGAGSTNLAATRSVLMQPSNNTTTSNNSSNAGASSTTRGSAANDDDSDDKTAADR